MPTQEPARQPRAELDARYSSALTPRPGARDVAATAWAEAERHLERAEIFWLSTVRRDDAHCALTTGNNSLTEGLDLVVEGTAIPVTEPAVLEEVITVYETKYGAHITSPEGTFHGMTDAFRTGKVAVFALSPTTAYGFGRDNGVYTHTRWMF